MFKLVGSLILVKMMENTIFKVHGGTVSIAKSCFIQLPYAVVIIAIRFLDIVGVANMKIMIDLFAGLGGASQAFWDDPDWSVIRIDNNRELLEHTNGLIISDVGNVERTLSIINSFLNVHHGSIKKLVIWASPPCNQYSYASSQRDPDNFDNSLLEAALEIIDALEPHAWIIENVKGAIDTFDDVIGLPWCQRIGGIFLWGQFPQLAFEDARNRHHKKWTNKGTRAMRPNLRALIPYSVSLAYKNCIDYQKTLSHFVEN